MTLFETFEARKKNGEVLQLYDLSRDELKQIWFDENHTDFDIGKLFGVSEYRIHKRRKELKLMWNNCVFENCCKESGFIDLLEKYKANGNEVIEIKGDTYKLSEYLGG